MGVLAHSSSSSAQDSPLRSSLTTTSEKSAAGSPDLGARPAQFHRLRILRASQPQRCLVGKAADRLQSSDLRGKRRLEYGHGKHDCGAGVRDKFRDGDRRWSRVVSHRWTGRRNLGARFTWYRPTSRGRRRLPRLFSIPTGGCRSSDHRHRRPSFLSAGIPRACPKCGCQPPIGECAGLLWLHENDACQSPFALTPTDGTCFQAEIPVRSARLRTSAPGCGGRCQAVASASCLPTGGESLGTAEPTGPHTFCCTD